jgi:hypothetical protein
VQPVITIFAICNNAGGGQKNLRICAGWCNKVVNVTLTPPINTSGIARISMLRGQTSEHSQQRIAKCKQRFVFPFAGFILIASM